MKVKKEKHSPKYYVFWPKHIDMQIDGEGVFGKLWTVPLDLKSVLGTVPRI